MREFAALIFRRVASKSRKTPTDTLDTFISLSNDQAVVIRQKLLETLTSESDRKVRNKISDAVAEIARQYTENGPFPLSLWFSCLSNANTELQATLGPNYWPYSSS